MVWNVARALLSLVELPGCSHPQLLSLVLHRTILKPLTHQCGQLPSLGWHPFDFSTHHHVVKKRLLMNNPPCPWIARKTLDSRRFLESLARARSQRRDSTGSKVPQVPLSQCPVKFRVGPQRCTRLMGRTAVSSSGWGGGFWGSFFWGSPTWQSQTGRVWDVCFKLVP